ncbi:Anti-sigma-28 factor, FlgM [Vibrio aerogenes CECT 7868]|uniref:Negative regulator of flagellin synthesis n=1 Tax=Vibrio aerogenes CECT 7868 TaxID=1216006 RepID=A0A1M5YLB5_9VIBR|nr:flagellar biosynthesis anti-sigma factor FlgM [Vibrio aerogenes]SHI12688.1 Anti-sigma-28 factor, FlgM [Vibrio aerogenes CECT 7868]
MKIDKVTGGHVPQTKLQQTGKKTLESTPVKQTNTDPELNINMAAIEKAQAEISSLPDVDMAKVEQVRQALSRGELSLDTKALSQALMKFHTGHESS